MVTRTPTTNAKLGVGRAQRRRTARGFAATEEILAIAAVLGCFVYPLSLAARTSGQHIADQTEAAHKTLLTQR